MSVGGRITAIHNMTIQAGHSPGGPTKVKRLTCLDKSPSGTTETCVFAEWYAAGSWPSIGDEVWWTAGKILFDNDRRSVRKVGYSFSP